jgi:hypothetical protein
MLEFISTKLYEFLKVFCQDKEIYPEELVPNRREFYVNLIELKENFHLFPFRDKHRTIRQSTPNYAVGKNF